MTSGIKVVARTEAERAAVIEAILAAPLPLAVELKKVGKQRTPAQNALLHIWCRLIGHECGDDERDAKQNVLVHVVGPRYSEFCGRLIEQQIHTSDMETAEFSSMLDGIKELAGDLGIRLPLTPSECERANRELARAGYY